MHSGESDSVYLYRAVDATGQTIDFLLSPKRDATAAQTFFRKTLGQPHVEQDRRRIKRLVRSGLDFKSFSTSLQTIAGSEAMAMLRKGQVVCALANAMGAQRDFMANLFGEVA
ncbi:DDE-type integrase/transposase/recombinase (plasmid) [Microvirga sp. RSM25]|uniref:DDE-type integrase/transposase/recombinase n=1 Tax=Microvirga sp. RSM25 TaxID=3273802 RepID=UPI00384B464F